MSSRFFNFVLCKKADVVDTRDGKVEPTPNPTPEVIRDMEGKSLENEGMVTKEDSKETEINNNADAAISNNKTSVPTLPVARKSRQSPKRLFKKRHDSDNLLHVTSVHADFSWVKSEFRDANGVKNFLKKKGKDLGKVKAKLCEDLIIIKDNFNTELFCDGSLVRSFREVYNECMSALPSLSSEFSELLNKYKEMSKRNSKTVEEIDLTNSFEITNLDNDSFISVLQKAMKLSTLQYKLNDCLQSSALQSAKIKDLESALLELQRLKLESEWDFNSESCELFSVSEEFTNLNLEKLFAVKLQGILNKMLPVQSASKLEKDAKLSLAEFHIHQLDVQQQKNSALYQLSQSINKRVEGELASSIEYARSSGIEDDAKMLKEAEDVLLEVKEATHKCRSDLKQAVHEGDLGKLNCALKAADNLHISMYDSVVLEAKREARKLQNRTEEYKKAIDELKKAIKIKDYSLIEAGLIKAKAIRSRSESNAVNEGVKMLTKLQKSTLAFSDENVDRVRNEIVETLISVSPEDVARVLIKAQVVGLNYCVEVMGARSRLSFLQGDDYRYSLESRKIEEHIQRTTSNAVSEDCTVDMILTLDRAITVCDKLELNNSVINSAKNALESLKERKEKVKLVKDDLQRAVMECRQEAIECAISEAESLPYFLTFDPMDGQLSAILEYAKKKVRSTKVDSNQIQNKLESAKIALKRAMRGRNSKKLKIALAIFRKSVNFDDIIDKADPIVSNDGGCHPEENEEQKMIRKAERRIKRLEKEEDLAQKEWEELQTTLRKNLSNALETNDRPELWKSVHQFKREFGSAINAKDKSLLEKATKRLYDVTIEQFKFNVEKAISDRDSLRLKHVLNEIDSPSHSILPVDLQQGKFAEDIGKARKLLVQLKEVNRLQKAVAEMTRAQVAELHSYTSPPKFVRAVMTSVFILLGEPENIIKEWSGVMRLMVKMGRDSITRRVGTFSSKRVALATAKRVKELLAEMEYRQVQDVSKGAAVFFAWCKCVSSEVIDRNYDPPRPKVDVQKRPITPAKEIANSEFWNRLSRPRSGRIASRTPRLVRVRSRPTSAMQ